MIFRDFRATTFQKFLSKMCDFYRNILREYDFLAILRPKLKKEGYHRNILMISCRLIYYTRAYRIQHVKWRGPRFEFGLYNGGSNLIGRSRCQPSPGPLLLLIGRLYICQSTGKNLYFPMVPLFFLNFGRKNGQPSYFLKIFR